METFLLTHFVFINPAPFTHILCSTTQIAAVMSPHTASFWPFSVDAMSLIGQLIRVSPSIQRCFDSARHLCHYVVALLCYRLSPHYIISKWPVVAQCDCECQGVICLFFQHVKVFYSHCFIGFYFLFQCTNARKRNVRLKGQ